MDIFVQISQNFANITNHFQEQLFSILTKIIGLGLKFEKYFNYLTGLGLILSYIGLGTTKHLD